uniref:ubiquitinyl hydrolase 1 n=1 Tax=Dracunculus medinensis TaxID=318479 RepID=A0A158Q5K0_DRAME
LVKHRSLGVVPGLSNLGNTCYINALLQGLARFFFLKISQKSCLFHLISIFLILKYSIFIEFQFPRIFGMDLYELFNVFVTTWDEEIHVLQSNSVHSSDKSNSLKETFFYVGSVKCNSFSCMNDGVNTSGKKYQYSLKAVSVHIGGPHSGHFITYRRGIGTENQDIWYRTSDSSVSFLFLVQF